MNIEAYVFTLHGRALVIECHVSIDFYLKYMQSMSLITTLKHLRVLVDFFSSILNPTEVNFLYA